MDAKTTTILQITNFSILVGILFYFGRKPILQMIADRRKSFKNQLAEANDARKDAEQQNQELQSRIKNLESEIVEIRDSSFKAIDLESKNMIETAERMSQFIKEESSRAAQQEVTNARKTLVDQILKEVTKKFEQELSSNSDGKLHESIIKKNSSEIDRIKV